jgi:Tol biopolymer transport system component
MASFWDELKRRKVFQVAVVYAIVGWVLAQIAATTFPVLLLPDWILRAFIIIVLLGFPLAIVLAWAFETTADGIKRDRGESSAEVDSLPGTERNLFVVVAITAGALVVGLILGGIIGKTAGQIPAAIDATRTPIQLTANPEGNPVIASAISPDGQYLAFVETSGLYLRIVESGESHQITLPEGMIFSSSEIDWFPSGTHLLLTARTGVNSSLWKVSVLSGDAKKLLNRVVLAAVSPDGENIAYVQSVFSHEVFIIGPDGERPEMVFKQENAAVVALGWSPDNEFLLLGTMVTAIEREQHLYAVNIASREVRSVLSDERTFQDWRGYLPYVLLPDGRLIYGRRELPPSDLMSNLWQVDIDLATGDVQREPIRLTNLTGYNFQDLSATSDGHRVAFVIEENQMDVYVGDIRDGGRSLVGVRRLTFDDRNDAPGGWSPDSDELYFQSERGVAENLFAQRIDGGSPRVLSGTLLSTSDSIQQSPDRKWLLYWEQMALYRMPVAGGPSELVLTGSRDSDFHCARSIEGGTDCIVSLHEPDNQYVFYKFNPEYGLGKKLLSVDWMPPFANWSVSPDETRIAMVHLQGMIRIFDVPSGEEKIYTDDAISFGEFIAWTADGTGLFLDATIGNGGRMKALVHFSPESGETVVLRDVPHQWHVRPRPSPDGKHLAVGIMTFSGNAWMIENP